MNHATRFTKLALLLIVAGALALAGCGGDDGIDQSVHDMALAAQAEAEAAAETAAAAEAEAETAAAAEAEAAAEALAAEEEARMEAAAAEEARMKAEADAAAEEEARMKAEADAAAEEEARMKAEADAAAAEEARMKAEADAAAAEEARMKAEEAAAKALMDVQMAADAAAMAAKTASDTAAMDATTAMDATMNIATLQTGEMSKMMAYDAKKAADGAMKAYMAAKAASEAANADDATIESATTARDMAVEAQGDAAAAAKMAMEKKDGAAKYAAMELMINGKMKSVGDIEIMVDGKQTTSGTDPVIMTGKLDENVSAMSGAVAAVVAVAAVDDVETTIEVDETEAEVIAKPDIEPQNVDIGVDYDSPDDSARLRLVTSHIGSGTVAGVYTGVGGTAIGVSQANHNAYDHDTTDTSPPVRIRKAPGLFYVAVDGVNADGTVEATVGEEGMPNKGTPLYYYEVVTTNEAGAVLTRTRTWLLRTGTLTASDGTVTHNYTPYTAATVATTLENFPMAMEYDHLHFGVWASISDPDKMGMQEVTDLGIGFVQNTSGMGMTMDMPNQGMAKYDGNWVATVQEQNKGAIALESGNAVLTADIAKATLTADLEGLVKLEGALTGNTFKGTEAKAVFDLNNDYGLNAGGKFTGTFSGGFYGDKAVEAGGVFDFTSEDIANGAFRGAFGGHRNDLPES